MVLEGQDVPQSRIVVQLSDWASAPRATQVEARSVLAATLARAGIARGALETMCFSENV